MMYIHISDTVRFSLSMYWIVHCVAVFWLSFSVCSLLPSMGPPPKGTLKHQSTCKVRNNVGKLRHPRPPEHIALIDFFALILAF